MRYGELREILEKARELGKEPYLAGQDLSTLDLSNWDLSGAILTKADLSHTDLRCANLTGVDLKQSVTTKAIGLVSIAGIGIRRDTFYAWRTRNERDKVIYMFKTGCFDGSEADLRQTIKNRVGWKYVVHNVAYLRAIPFMKELLNIHYKQG